MLLEIALQHRSHVALQSGGREAGADAEGGSDLVFAKLHPVGGKAVGGMLGGLQIADLQPLFLAVNTDRSVKGGAACFLRAFLR